MRYNTEEVDILEKDKGFHCVNYRSRGRYTHLGSARKCALNSV